MRHLTDEELIALAGIKDSRLAEQEAHMSECSACMARWASIVSLEQGLEDEDSYEEDDSRRAQINEYAARLVREDAEARVLLREYLREPAMLTWANLGNRSRYRSGGVVRVLIDAAQEACEKRPLHALNFADAAIDVSRVLRDDLYPSHAIYEFRGAAWKARANACRYLGRYQEARIALVHAEKQYRQLPHAGIGLAAVHYVQALLYWEQEEWGRALIEAEQSEHAFAHLGLTDRYNSARIVRAMVLSHAGRTAEARELFSLVLSYGESTENVTWIGRASLGLGRCYLDEGDLSTAFTHYSKARDCFEACGAETEVIRAEWGIARVIVRQKPDEGLRRLFAVEAAFAQREMVTDAALVGLDVVEFKVLIKEFDAVALIASHIAEIFVNAGKVSSALSAAAYLKESAVARKLTLRNVDFIKNFIRRAERQPDLVFIPPPFENTL